MATAAGVNEGSPQEPMNPAPAQTAPADAEVPEAELADPGPEPADAGAAGDESDLTEPAEEQANPEQASPEQADAEQADVERARDMSPLAIIGVIVVVIALVGVAAGVLSVVTHGFHRKTVVSYKPAAVFTLKPGDCVDSSGSGLTFTLLACSKPHSSEVFATFALTGSDWPGTSAVQTDAGNGCADRLASYLNPDLSNAGLAQEYIYPNESAWKAGEHTVVCEVRSSTGQMTGSVRKAS
jgi:hypothetical protein